jgi:hypothetical protein
MSLIATPHTETNWEINWKINAAVQALTFFRRRSKLGNTVSVCPLRFATSLPGRQTHRKSIPDFDVNLSLPAVSTSRNHGRVWRADDCSYTAEPGFNC